MFVLLDYAVHNSTNLLIHLFFLFTFSFVVYLKIFYYKVTALAEDFLTVYVNIFLYSQNLNYVITGKPLHMKQNFLIMPFLETTFSLLSVYKEKTMMYLQMNQFLGSIFSYMYYVKCFMQIISNYNLPPKLNMRIPPIFYQENM